MNISGATIRLEEGKHRIPIGGRWSLEDLYVFPRAFEQIYFLFYSLLPHEEDWIQERIQHAYAQFPWRGGYSAVNFYNTLKYTTPRKERPQVLSLQYASPGWIELGLIVGVAVAVERLAKSIATMIREANAIYHEIHEGLSKRRLLRIEVAKKELELEGAHAQFIEESVQRMIHLLGLSDADQMHAKTGSPLKTLKILFSMYRRVRILADYQIRGKTRF
jgi:hypothetical protein